MAGDGAVLLLVHAAEGDQHVPALQGGESAFCCRLPAETLQDHPVSGWEGGGIKDGGGGFCTSRKIAFQNSPISDGNVMRIGTR